ncbi:MAG: aminotransferase class I/II-fold pyridoxal phosphate-dependent enzyme [Anaerolineales bacterium]|nr:aminotransferase class I/II-fold pyridoxal phosphate-dependent enzyme [Anaerolineales bacterium]
MKPISRRVQPIDSANAFQIWHQALELEKQGVEMIHLILGEPDFSTPDHIVTAATAALWAGRTKYGSVIGSHSFQQAAAAYFTRTRGINARAEQIFPAPGVKALLFFSMLALIDEGDELLLPDLSYPAYREILSIAGGREVEYRLDPARGFQPDIASIRAAISPHTKAIILNSPNNPTGSIIDEATTAALAELVLANDLWVILDEIYYQFSFDSQRPPSLFSYPGLMERTILMDGLSKPYAMTGWRVGFAHFPAGLVDSIKRLLISGFSCLPPFIVDAATEALTGPQDSVAELTATYQARRDLMLPLLERIDGLRPLRPAGAFYIWVDMRALPAPGQFVEQLLHQGVAVMPGSSFGPAGDDYFRIALTQPAPLLQAAAARIERAVAAQYRSA